MTKDFKTRLKRPEHILVVDDDLWIVEVIAKQLDLAGFRVKMTTDSSQVMDMLGSEHYDLVISDVCMPSPDGLTLLKEIQHAYPFLAVLMLTAVSDVETATQAMLRWRQRLYCQAARRNTALFARRTCAGAKSLAARTSALPSASRKTCQPTNPQTPGSVPKTCPDVGAPLCHLQGHA